MKCRRLFALAVAVLFTVTVSGVFEPRAELKTGKVLAQNMSEAEKPATLIMGSEGENKQQEDAEKTVINEEKQQEESKIEEPKDEKPKAVPVAQSTTKTSTTSGKAYRLTSYWYGDGSGKCTGTGLCIDDFQVNEKGWYTYQGKLVLAAATNACLKSRTGACGKWNTRTNRDYYDYYDEVTVKIDGVSYKGIILDSCGASMYVTNEQRLDLFVSNESSAIDRGYKGNNPITVWS